MYEGNEGFGVQLHIDMAWITYGLCVVGYSKWDIDGWMFGKIPPETDIYHDVHRASRIFYNTMQQTSSNMTTIHHRNQ